MPFIHAQGIRHYYRVDGADDRPIVLLSHSLGHDHGLWDAQVRDLLPHFRVVRYDTRGHGATGAPTGDYSIAQLGNDALALMDALGAERFAFAGLSLGGMVGQWLAVNAPHHVTHLVLANTTARLSDPGLMEARRRAALDGGMMSVVDVALQRAFSPAFLAGSGPAVDWVRRTILATDPAGYAGCCAAIRDLDHRQMLEGIRVPTMVISGSEDVSMPPDAHGDLLVRGIAGSRSLRLPAGHLSNLERPRSFTSAMLEFLLPPADGSAESGTRVRRAVLGDAHVDRSLQEATDLTRDFQDLVTRFPWGTIWARPGLDRRTRRLLVLTTTAALGRWEEFRLHLRTGLAHELEPCDVKEVLLQLAAYAGVPAANTAFHVAAEEIRE